MMSKPVVILGAGIAGLSAAYKLEEAKVNYKIFEKNKRSGGLLDCFEINGFRFDQAVHLSFADQVEVRQIFDQTQYIKHKPESKCFEKDKWLRHPVQNNLYPLPALEKVKLIKSFVERPNIDINNYYDWLIYQYGVEIAERYPIRYTLKYWDTDPSLLGLDWIGNRMHRATLEEILEGAMTQKTPNYYYAKEMRYPKKGGFISFLNPLLQVVTPDLNKDVSSVDIENRIVFFADGSTVEYSALINTMPLPLFIKKIINKPNLVKECSERLTWTKVNLVSIGFNKPDLVKDLWMYIYDEDIFAARAYSPSLKSKDNCPRGCSSIQFEVYEKGGVKSRFKPSELIKNSIYALKKLGIANAEHILFSDSRSIEYGNVVFYKGMEDDRDYIMNWLGTKGVRSAGRFGCWEYFWSHQAMESGFRAARDFI